MGEGWVEAIEMGTHLPSASVKPSSVPSFSMSAPGSTPGKRTKKSGVGALLSSKVSRIEKGGCSIYLAPSVAEMNMDMAVVTRSGLIARSRSSRCMEERLRSQSPTMGPPPPGSVPTSSGWGRSSHSLQPSLLCSRSSTRGLKTSPTWSGAGAGVGAGVGVGVGVGVRVGLRVRVRVGVGVG